MQIFLKYNQGASFKELAEMMQNTSIAYDMDKPWNKNMVARILGDNRYIGRGEFPIIIGQDIFQRSILGHILPEAMVCYLENYEPEKFSEIFLGEFDTPEAIWSSEMR